jgi:lipoate-protein ligase A
LPAGGATSQWSIVELAGSASELHHRDPVNAPRTVTLCRVSHPAVVLGSVQPDGDVDRGRAASFGLEIVRRRTGGGAVLVEPGALAWIEVYVSNDDRLWVPDVGRAFWWLGQAWADALEALGVGGASVHHGPPVTTAWSAKVCFAGTGAGEVTVRGRKVVGMAQRRTRAGALFQCAALLRWDAARLLDVLDLAEAERAEGAVTLGDAATGLGPARRVGDIERSLVEHLPS